MSLREIIDRILSVKLYTIRKIKFGFKKEKKYERNYSF